MDINEAHETLGHASPDTTRVTAKELGWTLTGNLVKCKNCSLAKIKTKTLNPSDKETVKVKVKKDGLYLGIDISKGAGTSLGGNRYWIIIQDLGETDMCWSHFVKKKSELTEVMNTFFLQLKKKDKIIKGAVVTIRLDNAGENTDLQAAMNQSQWDVQFEYTAPNTPQQNGKSERKFATLKGRIRAMMNWAELDEEFRWKLWAYAAHCATQHDVILTSRHKRNSYKLFWNVQPHYIGNLKFFGETGTVKTLIKGNMVTNRGFTGMFVGYPENHAAGTFLMLNLKTKKVVTTRTVDWNNESYGTTMKLAKENICNLPFENEDIESDEDGDFIHDILDVGGTETELENANNQATTLEENNDGEITETKLNRVHELRNLECFDNPTPGAYKDSGRLLRSGMIQEKLSTMTEIQDSERRELCFLTNELEETYTPMKYSEAWDHPETKERERWRAAIKKEMEDAIKRGVYKKCKRKDVPSNKRCVKCKWVFKRKTSGIYRARLVACGYSQIVNVDFTESFSPVINDLCWKILIILKIVMNLSIRLLDVETAFQHGDLDHQIFMEPPPGLEHFMDINPEEDCVELGQCTYGLVQASRQYRKKFVATVKKHGVYETKVDPCLMTKVNAKTGKPEIYMGTHVDDSLTVGKLEDIKKLQEHMNKEGLTTKCEEVDEYLGCKVAFSKDGKKAWLGQPETIKKLEREFGEDVKKLKSYTVPGTPGIGVLRPSSKEDVLGPEEQSRYRSGVGMLLWINKTRPDLSNAVRELSKVADGATKEAMKEMMRVIKYTIDTKNIGLKIEPKVP